MFKLEILSIINNYKKGGRRVNTVENAGVDKFIEVYLYMQDVLNCLMKNEKTEIKYISDIDKLDLFACRKSN